MSAFYQLLVLGNGFDLECGLASTFNDFEIPRLQDLPSRLGSQGVTVWDLVLQDSRRNRSWFDVESSMGEWLGPSSPHIDKIMTAAAGYLRSRAEGEKALDSPADPDRFLHMDAEGQVAAIMVDRYGWTGGEDKHTLYDCFMDQLHIFEREFSDYLRGQVASDPEYSRRCHKLITALINDRLPDPNSLRPWEEKPELIEYDGNGKQFKGHPENVSLLDFNYTDPFAGLRDCPSLANIHGNLTDGDIVFGIDGSNLSASDPDYADIVKFTKTFRLMALRRENNITVIHPYVMGRPGNETDIIKFYGHSLGPADYSYFQSLFDTVDLYESQTRLVFYYNEKRRNGDPSAGVESPSNSGAAGEMYEKVNRLMTRYGETLDNESHGRNILHKLLLEGRLSVAPSPR